MEEKWALCLTESVSTKRSNNLPEVTQGVTDRTGNLDVAFFHPCQYPTHKIIQFSSAEKAKVINICLNPRYFA